MTHPSPYYKASAWKLVPTFGAILSKFKHVKLFLFFERMVGTYEKYFV